MGNQVKIVELAFEGEGGEKMARRFFSYLVDGGLEDQLIQTLGGKGLELEIGACDDKSLRVQFRCRRTATKSTEKDVANATKKSSAGPAKKSTARR